MKQELDQKIENMRDNVERAEESGDWDELLNRVRESELIAARTSTGLIVRYLDFLGLRRNVS